MTFNGQQNEFEFKLDKDSPIPLYRQIGDAITALAERGALSPDTKLPAIRRFAELLGVNNVTVVNAYRYLENRGVVYSMTGSGTYVSRLSLPEAEMPSADFLSGVVKHPEQKYPGTEVIDFTNGSTSKTLFPVDEFKRLFNEVLEKDRGDAFGYEEVLGYLPLRGSFCGYMAHFGVQTNPERVHVISGAQQGIDIISKVLLSPGDVVLTEKPTYFRATASFISRGAKVCGIDIQKNGIDIDKLEAAIKQYKPKLVYCMPYFQTPTCYSYSLEKKMTLLELAYRHNFYIIEEDSHSDFNYNDSEITPLKALDYKNRVIYIKSFSKILMPGLRIGFMLMPKAISEAAKAAKYTADIDTSGFLQRAFDLFIECGAFYVHRAKMKDVYKKKYESTLGMLNSVRGRKLRFAEPGGGLNFWLTLPSGVDPADFFERLVEKSVIVSEGSGFTLNQETLPSFKISFADLSEDKISKGISIIGECLNN